MRQHFTLTSLLLALVLPFGNASADLAFRGNVSAQARMFSSEALYPNQEDSALSLAAQPEWYWQWNEGKDSLTLELFGRWDQNDDERTHTDVRQLAWIHVADQFETRVGLRRVFWGVTEFQHLVDIINQSDFVEDVDAEDKLGQPMINVSTVQDWGIVDLFVMPYFRERTFAGLEGRPRLPLPVFVDDARYQSSDEEQHMDYALRWYNNIDVVDIGVSYFDGTSRDPLLIPDLINGELGLVPYYQQIAQWGIDAQATVGEWLLKAEAIHRQSDADNYFASQLGFEYTLVGAFDSSADLGLLVEYGWDERGTEATALFQNDVLVGARLALNDMASSTLLMGISQDLDYQSQSLLIEGSRRFGDSVVLSLDVRLFSSDEPRDTLYSLRQDDYVQFNAEWYF